jgi:osmoprotectant transport system permease protein
MRILYALLLFSFFANADLPVIKIGSKNFTEGYVLAEILAQKIEELEIAKVDRKFGMGGTGILFDSLVNNAIDIYPEYTGTISLAILHEKSALTKKELKKRLQEKSLEVSESLGFNNSYGLAIPKNLSDKLKLTKISQLKDHKDLRMAFSYEFMERKDGYPALVEFYSLNPPAPVRMDHALVYTALQEGKADVVEVYTTDSKIEKFKLVVLEDDLGFFPKYEGVFVFRKELLDKIPAIRKVMRELEGRINDKRMTQLNSLVENEGKNFSEAAATFVKTSEPLDVESDRDLIVRLTKRHLLLVLIPVLVSLLIGIPMGVAAAKIPWIGRGFLLISGLFQTIPSLALLCFLIPFFGIGLLPSMVALVLYGLLPIVRSTYSGLVGIEVQYREVAKVLGLSRLQRLIRIEIPLASTHIMGGIQTAAVMNVGVATLAAFIGAGGYGALIVTGLALNDNAIILKGALPAAVMAVVVHFAFEIIERILTPKGLRS